MSESRRDRLCRNTARAQFGALSHAQAVACGHTDSSIHRKLAGADWDRVVRRVYAYSVVPKAWEQRAMAAHLSLGEPSALSFETSAAVRNYLPKREPIHVSTTRNTTRPAHWVRLHRIDEWLLREIEHVGPLPVTSTRRTVLDLAGVGDRRAERVLDHALRVGDTSIKDIALMLDDPGMRGKRGVARLGNMIIARDPLMAPTDSEMEDLALRVLRRYGTCPMPRPQWPELISTGPIRLDLAWPDILFGVELDSREFHLDLERFESDRKRDDELMQKGWLSVRYTWTTLRFEPAKFAASIQAHIRNRTPKP